MKLADEVQIVRGIGTSYNVLVNGRFLAAVWHTRPRTWVTCAREFRTRRDAVAHALSRRKRRSR